MKEVIHEMYSKEQIDQMVTEIATRINKDYEGKQIHMICILRGYGNEVKSSGQLMITKDLDDDIDGRHCLIVEDIIDSGNTLSKICGLLAARNPASLKIATLLDKPDRREVDVEVDYTGFVVPDKFIVGYGLDYAQKYRNLPYLGEVEFVDE